MSVRIDEFGCAWASDDTQLVDDWDRLRFAGILPQQPPSPNEEKK